MMKITILILILIFIGLIYYFYFYEKPHKIYTFSPVINKLMIARSFSFLTNKECDYIINIAEKNTWTRKRHKYYPTVDQEVKNIPELKFLYNKIYSKVFPIIKDNYGFNNVKINDFFIVKYDLTSDGMDKLDIHRDTSVLNFIVSLSSLGDYDGGGTYYPEFNQIIKPNKGEIFLNSGKLKHGGAKITKGIRYILIGFLDVFDNCINHNYLESINFKIETPDLTVMNNIFYKQIDIYVINLEHRKDRKNSIIKLLENLIIPNAFKININIIKADMGNKGKSYKHWKTNKKYNDLPSRMYKYWQRDITKGEIGCFNSHLSILEKIKEKNNDENTINLVLEDDADFGRDFLVNLKQIYEELIVVDNKWDLCFLGRYALKNNNMSLSRNIEETGYSYNTHCYIISDKVVKKILDLNLKNKIIPYDEFLTALAWSHPREEINKLYFYRENKINSYSVKKNLSQQKGFGYSDIN